MRTLIALAVLLAACVTEPDDYPVLPQSSPLPPSTPLPPAARPFTGTYELTWVRGPVLDAYGEVVTADCSPQLCAPITRSDTLVIGEITDGLRITFTGPEGSTVADVTAATGDRVTVAARRDSVGARRLFDVVRAGGTLTGSPTWDVAGDSAGTDDDLVVYFTFVAR